jgi:hypothetical protein
MIGFDRRLNSQAARPVSMRQAIVKGEAAGADVEREKTALEVMLSINEPLSIKHKELWGIEIPDTMPEGFMSNFLSSVVVAISDIGCMIGHYFVTIQDDDGFADLNVAKVAHD